MPSPVLSVDEYIETLKRSKLPTVITEGLDDYLAFRRLEEAFSDVGLSLMPVGGKDTVLDLFRRRNEFPQISTAFIADQDFWIFSSVPPEFHHPTIIFTEGYSIENDLYRDGDIETLLTAAEKEKFERDLREMMKWFSYAIGKILNNQEIPINIHPRRMLDINGTMRQDFLDEFGYTEPPENIYEKISGDYRKYLRGKSLLALLVCYLSHTDRPVKHSNRSLLEAASVRGGPYMSRFHTQIGQLFRPA